MSYEMKEADVYGLAASVNADTVKRGKELFFRYCPYCSGGTSRDKDTFSVNLSTGAFKCFRAGCGVQGHFVELARDFNYPLDFGDDEPKQYKALPQIKPPVREAALKYLLSRGIPADVGRRYEITTDRNDDTKLMFMFRDENGILKFVKYRKTNFDKSRDKNKEWSEPGTQPILFGMDKCADFKRLIVTEGQLDSLSVAAAGLDNAVSVPTGATGFSWVKSCHDWVAKFEEIVIFGDCEKNTVTLVDGFVKHFGDKKIRVVQIADYLGEKDANDILRKYGKEAIIKCVNNASELMTQNVKRLSEVKSVDLEAQEKIKTGIYSVDKVIGGLYLGMVTLLTGRRGDGKSTLASQMVANALDQTDPDGLPYSVFIYSGELPNYHFKRWLDLQIAGKDNVSEKENEYGNKTYSLKDGVVDKINAWYHDRAYIYDNAAIMYENENSEHEALIVTIENVIKRYNTKLILIDNLMTAIEPDPKSDLYREQSRFIGKIKTLAMKYNVAVLLIAHPRKDGAGDKRLTNDSVSGSADITNRVDVVMSYTKCSPPKSRDGVDIHGEISVTKNRLTGVLANDIATMYGNRTKRIYCNNTERDKEFGCFKKSEKSELSDDWGFDEYGGVKF